MSEKPCGVCGGLACAGSGNYAVCSEYCAMVAKEYTVKDQQIATLQSDLAERWKKLNAQDVFIDGLKEEITRLNEYIAEMVRMAAAKHRPAYDEQQKIIMGLQEEIAALRVIARSAAQEEETKLDENQFITQQSRIVKLAALREAGYLKEEG